MVRYDISRNLLHNYFDDSYYGIFQGHFWSIKIEKNRFFILNFLCSFVSAFLDSRETVGTDHCME